MDEDEISAVAMKVILNAGDARSCLDEATVKLEAFDFAGVDKALEEADQKILLAHNAQTEMIQRQAAGEKFEYSLLFVHAQDTLMTIDAERHLFKRLVPVFQALEAQK